MQVEKGFLEVAACPGYLFEQAGIRLLVKRLFDLSAAVILLIILFPVALLIIFLIAISGQHPFYSHVRIGRRGREFGCLKFRTMHRDADALLAQLLRQDPQARIEWEINRKLRKDPRVTRLGRLLRATSLDELPQLVNVLSGHMSLVGPRPVTNDELATFYGPSDASAYMSVRPGLTGLWQVSGRSEVGFDNRVTLDTFYVQRMSLRTDIGILVRTMKVIFCRHGAW